MDSKSSGSNGKEDLNGLPASVPLSTWLEPSWAGTNQFYLNFEDAQSVGVSDASPFSHGCLNLMFQLRLGMDATRISDGKPVILKRTPSSRGPLRT